MSGYKRQGTFDDLNAAMASEIERLLQADTPEAIEAEVKRAHAVGKLGTVMVNNHANAIQVARLLSEEGMDVSGLRATMPRMLGGGDEGE